MIVEATFYNSLMKDFGTRLKALRSEKGLQQNDLARIAKLNPVQVSKYERGERYPNAENLLALAEALGVTLDALMAGNPNSKPGPQKEVYRFPLLLDRAKEVDRELDRKDVEAIISFLDAYLAKKRIRQLVSA